MRNICFCTFFLCPSVGMAFSQEDFDKLIRLDDLKALQQMIVSTTASCVAEAATNPANLAMAKKELLEMSQGISEVISEELLALALKKDFPSLCHVMSQGMLRNIEEDSNEHTECIKNPTSIGPECIGWQRQSHPKYKYYWPKYFIEVSQKGNDSHPSFSEHNLLYAANRKIANALSSFIDLKGPYTLAAMAIGASHLLKSGTAAVLGQGFDINVSDAEMKAGMGTVVLTPFEKMRIRNSQKSDQPSFDVNIWPVGLSATIAEKLSVCREGGYKWSISGVPMTCPVAMSKDAWSYWDSGLFDYINPAAIKGIVATANPVACIAENISSVKLDDYSAAPTHETVERPEEKDRKKAQLANLTKNFRGLSLCSMPILGKAQEIAEAIRDLPNGFKGPWCTLWGPVVPRMSTHVQNTDFAFPAAALKFKLLAHDLFGVARGRKERWALAYPWEESASDAVASPWDDEEVPVDRLGPLKEYLEKVGGTEMASEYTNTNKGRSLTLMPPGDPRLMDVFSLGQLKTDAKNFAREIAYIASLNGAASAAEQAALQAFAREQGVQRLSQEEVLQQYRREVARTTEETAREKGEPIYEARHYCQVKGEKKGLWTRDDVRMQNPVPGHDDSRFERFSNAEDCHILRGGNCIDRHPITGKCLRPETVTYISHARWELTGYKDVQNPRKFVVELDTCRFSEENTPSTHPVHYRCAEGLRVVGREDTRDQVAQPNLANPDDTVLQDTKPLEEGSEQIRAATRAASRTATWVSAEIARARYEDITGHTLLPGKKRVYTIFEEIECEPKSLEGKPIFKKKIPGGWYWESCKDAIKLEVTKYFQTRMLRKVCDSILQQKLGQPFQS